MRTLAVEENVANSQDPKTKKKWNPRYPVEAKAELERREAIQKEEEEQRKKLRRPGKPESLRPGTRRPLLKSTNTEFSREQEIVESESDDEVISNIV